LAGIWTPDLYLIVGTPVR